MRWVTFVACVLLAGCSGKASVSDDLADTDQIIVDDVLPNQAPIAIIDADLLAGDAPFLVNFTLDAVDPEDDTLNWTFDADGDGVAEFNGTTLPANVTFTYETPGNFSATLAVSDGVVEVSGVVVVSVAGIIVPTVECAPPMEAMTFSGAAVGVLAAEVLHTFDVVPCQKLIHATIAYGVGAGDVDWAIRDPSGAEKDSAASFDPVGEGALDVDAPVPGTWIIAVTPYASVVPDYTITVTFA